MFCHQQTRMFLILKTGVFPENSIHFNKLQLLMLKLFLFINELFTKTIVVNVRSGSNLTFQLIKTQMKD